MEILDNKNEVCFTCGYGKKGTPLTLRSKKMPRIVRRLQKTRVADLNTFYQIISKKKYMNQGICNQIMVKYILILFCLIIITRVLLQTTKCAMCKNILAGVVKKCFNVITFRKNIKKISEIDLMGLIAKDELSKLTKKQLNVAWRIGLEKTKGRDLKKLIGQNFTNPKQNIICAPGTPELIKSNSLEAPDVLTNLKFT